MPRSTPRTTPTQKSSQHPPISNARHEVVDPIWLLKAIGLAMAGALVCAYLTLGLLFYQGQWQLALHPKRTSSSPPSFAGIPYQLVHFAPDESASPQLAGWWIPAAPSARYAYATILFLPGANGSLADFIPTLAALHNIGINVFAFDYRGYGQSAPIHPNQQNMIHDAESALQYLTISRAISPRHILLYGANIGAPLAAQLAATHPAIPAIILDSPYADLLPIAQHDPRAAILPVRLLFHERFALAEPLSHLRTPKLLIFRSTMANECFEAAANPKIMVELSSADQALYSLNVTRFLDQYLPTALVSFQAPAP